MAEVLGLMASVIAVMQLIETVDKTVSKYLSTVKNVRSELVPLLSRLRHLHAIMKTLEAELEKTRSMTLQYLSEPLRACESLLTRVDLRLNHLKVIAGRVVGPVLDKESTQCLKQLDALIPVLQLALDADTNVSTHAIEDYIQSLRLESLEQAQILQDDIKAHHDDARRWREEAEQQRKDFAKSQSRREILKWLDAPNSETNYQAAREKTQTGTGRWFLESKDFSEWVMGETRTLWLNAMAGAGKTILSSTVINHLVVALDRSHVIYYFFDFKDIAKQSLRGLVTSLLIQSVSIQENLPEVLSELFERHRLRNPIHPTLPSNSELLTVLIDILDQDLTRFIVIDGLDECKERDVLLHNLGTLLDKCGTNCRFLFASRAESEIQLKFKRPDVRNLHMQKTEVDRDVNAHIRAVLGTDDRLCKHRQGVKELIIETLTRGANGMFRWVQCQIDHIRTLRTANDIKKALGKLPPGLDETYDAILLSVPSEDQEVLRKALQLICFSARPLRLAEVAEAVIVEPGISYIDDDDRLQRPEDLLDIGKSLFVQDGGRSKYLELSHFSVKEYLISERIKRGPAVTFAVDEDMANRENAICLLTYLGLKVFEDDFQRHVKEIWYPTTEKDCRREADVLAREHTQHLQEYPLLDYAAKSCLRHHCRAASVQRAVSTLILDSFSSTYNGRFMNMTYTCVFIPDDPLSSYDRLFRYSLMNCAAHFNLTIIVQDLLAAKTPVDCLPPRPAAIKPYPEGQTALYRAADFGHEDLCKILIDAGASVHGVERYDCPLSSACRSGKPAIVRMILEAGASVVKDARPLAETQVTIWWRLVEEKTEDKWQIILNVLRDAGARWSTIGLLAAFSKSTKPLIDRAMELIEDDGPEKWLQKGLFNDLVDERMQNTLDALQWLVQDDAGISGFKTSLLKIFHAIHESQPHLFAQEGRVSARHSIGELMAENLIHIYFRPSSAAPKDGATATVKPSSEDILDATWDNVSLTQGKTIIGKSTSEKASSLAALLGYDSSSREDREWNEENLIVNGQILRAWRRGRWEEQYVHFFD